MQGRVFVVSGDPADAERLASPLRDRGWDVSTDCEGSDAVCEHVAASQPMAVLISLDFDTGSACDLACALSVAAATRHLPIVFVGGTSDDIEMAVKVAPHARLVTPSQVAWEIKRISLRQ